MKNVVKLSEEVVDYCKSQYDDFKGCKTCIIIDACHSDIPHPHDYTNHVNQIFKSRTQNEIS